MSNKAMDGAERKGREAAAAGAKRTDNPYGDVRGDRTNCVTFSRAFQTRWFAGFDKQKLESAPPPAREKGARE